MKAIDLLLDKEQFDQWCSKVTSVQTMLNKRKPST
jgi:hypothetical protein